MWESKLLPKIGTDISIDQLTFTLKDTDIFEAPSDNVLRVSDDDLERGGDVDKRVRGSTIMEGGTLLERGDKRIIQGWS